MSELSSVTIPSPVESFCAPGLVAESLSRNKASLSSRTTFAPLLAFPPSSNIDPPDEHEPLLQ